MEKPEKRGDKARLIFSLISFSIGFLLLVSCLLLISPSRSAITSGRTDPGLASETTITFLLSKDEIAALEPKSVGELGALLVARAMELGRSPEKYAASFFPSASEILAMLARDRDVDDYLENAEEAGAGGDYYQRVVDLVPWMKPLRTHYEALFLGVFSALHDLGRTKDPMRYPSGRKSYKGGVTLTGLSSRPMRRDLDLSHTYALDIFFMDVEKSALSGAERGPVILALEGGIVVSASSSWRGGAGLSKYRSGGIAPKSGNGIIIYSPRSRRYYLYFHLHDLFLKVGDAIVSGQPLGKGGNTGANARIPGHGEHLHVEVFDLPSGRFLRNTEILDLIFN
ncbi:MAG: M23 family metallopeptidase [Spirochaetes bacterium]|nr:M23 family metallopeptidase [Spirochaetota bacterium]